MSAAADLLAELQARGVRLEPAGARLRALGPRGALTPDLAERVRLHREELLAALLEGDARAPGVDSPSSSEAPPADPRSRLGAAPGSPAAALEDSWRRAWERACAAYARHRLYPAPARIVAAARLEADLADGVPVLAASPERVRELLRRAYAGELWAQLRVEGLAGTTPRPAAAGPRCEGCRRAMPEGAGPFCTACDLGLDEPAKQDASALMPDALELREERGPAGARGVRQEEVEARAAERKARRRWRRTLH